MKLSVVVPVYNTEKFLNKCIMSLLKQDIDEYEVLIINDSSPDNSQNLIDKFLEEYPHIIRSYIKKNGGLGDTRNYALPLCKGEYVLFVDSDDYVKEYSFLQLYNKMKKENLDILVFDFIKVYNEITFVHEPAIQGECSLTKYILSTPNACNKMFKMDLFVKNQISFPTKIWYEDLALIPGLVKFTNKIGYLNSGIYYYQFRSQSIMNQVQYNSRILDMIQSIHNLSGFLGGIYDQELEFLSISHLYYGSSLKLIPFGRIDELVQCLEKHEYDFPRWELNRFYKNKPILYKCYCFFLKKRLFYVCNLLLRLRKTTTGG